MSDDLILLDVSRLIWRQWTHRLPTGIGRVCLAYLEHFRSRARAVIQFRGFRHIFGPEDSARLFKLLLSGAKWFRLRLTILLAGTIFRAEGNVEGKLYLNVGHTGLNSPFLEPWLDDHGLRPLFFIHDLIPITHPQYCREGEAARHDQRMETALRTADAIVVNSNATRLELVRYANDRGLPVPPVHTAWLGVEPAPTHATIESLKRDRPYFLLIGTIEARKNHLLMLQIWADIVARLGSKAPDLIVIGQRGWEAHEAIAIIDNPGPLADRVHELPRCDDASMHRLLKDACAMLMPSFVEGFGLPLVEALQQGVPVIASNLPVFREIAGVIPTYIDPNDRQAWYQTILDYAADGAERRRQLKAATEFRAPSWGEHFASVEAFLETLKSGRSTKAA